MIDNPRDFGKELLPTCLGRGSARPLDQFDLVSIGSVNEDEAATRRTCGRAVGDADALSGERSNRLFEVIHLKREVHEIFLDLDRSAWGKTGQLNEFLAVRNL